MLEGDVRRIMLVEPQSVQKTSYRVGVEVKVVHGITLMESRPAR